MISAAVIGETIKPYYDEDGITIYNADCREILPHLEPVDLVLTDPPYGINENSRKQQSRINRAVPTNYGFFDWDKKPPTQEVMQAVVQSGKSAIVWGGNFFGLPASSCWLVWDKVNTGDFADCELAWSNLKGAVRIFRWMWNGMYQQDMANKERRMHPTQKPLPVIKWCLSFAPNAQTVLDPFMGSGTTLRAAKDLGLRAIGIEIEKKYCDIAIERLRQRSLLTVMADKNTN